jgi:hypothetical protein
MKSQLRTSIEFLEQRIAPAAVTINPALHTATWTDFDGDHVTLKYSSSVAPTFATSDNGAGLLVDRITLDAASSAHGDFSIKVQPVSGGDGRVDIGRLNSTGIQIATWISPKATFAEFDSGKVNTTAERIVVGTLGAIPYTKFMNTGGDGSSTIEGAVASCIVRGDIIATILVAGSDLQSTHLTITGDINGVGADVAESAAVHFRGDSNSLLTIKGDVIGGNELHQGIVVAETAGAKVVLKGSLIGGVGPASGQINCPESLGIVTIGGDVIGGSGVNSGYVYAAKGLGTLKIAGDLVGGYYSGAGHVFVADGFVERVTIGGSVLGGTQESTGVLLLNDVGSIKIKGSLVGGFGTIGVQNSFSGAVYSAHDLRSLVIGGDLVGGTYGDLTQLSYNGAVLVNDNLGSLLVKGSILGHNGYQAIVMAGGVATGAPGDYNAIGKVNVLGDVHYGYIAAGQTYNGASFDDRIGAAENPDAGIGRVTVGGDWFHSNLSAGINDNLTTGISSGDSRSQGDAARHAVLGPVVIKGGIFDNPNTTGFSGFAAEKIAKITAAGVKLFQSGDPARSVDPFGFVDIAEI